ncbi:mitochondrial amidoxime-reducing component 1-like [Culicoides brevitarsis]|uniref:mitochondrial amidoxime-reducing component 1-like n=1 Tax=Culicoides brevitarsis TaxID=469753 RepID=UPI00307C57D2
MRKFSLPCVALAFGSVAVIGLIIVYRRNRKCQKKSPPTNWKAVGEVTDLFCFPIKSCGVVRVKEINCSQLGFQENLLRDRIFMVTDHEGNFVTARQQPKLVRIFPQIEGNVMKLTAAGMLDIEIRLEEILKKSRRIGRVWGQEVEVIDCGDDVSRWLSRFIFKKDEGLHLFYYPSYSPSRVVRDCNKYAEYEDEHVGALHDATSYMMINESSITELNSRLDNLIVTPMNFRPNFVIKGPPAFAEDDFQWVKIGDETTFRAVKPCTRCIFTTIDPETGVKDPNGEPLKTLRTYRMFPGVGNSPVMGMHLGVVAYGNVKIGDTVYIGKA